MHHSGEDLNHPMEEVVITTTPMLWTWITSHYPQSSELTTCVKITASYVIRKAVLLGIILVTIRVTQWVVGTTTQNHPRLPETTNELDPLKGLTRLLTLVEVVREGGERITRTQESYSEELLGKLQENLTEVLWRQIWPLYTTHNVCT